MAQFLFSAILCTLFHTLAILDLTVGEDTLSPNQRIGVGQTLVSSNHDFEMGFFSPGKSPNRYLGIWHRSTPDVVVWVANRNNPVTDSRGVTFGIAQNGALVISRGGSTIWLVNSSSVVASNPVLQLLDTGNLVLVDETTKGYLWQSFDYPTDTLLPGMKLVNDIDTGVEIFLTSWRSYDDPSPGDFVVKIENEGLPELVHYRGKMKTFRTGKFNGVSFSGILRFPNPVCLLDLVFNEERLVSLAEPYEGSIFHRISLDTYGSVHRYSRSAKKDKWNHLYTFPGDQCDQYGLCGPNAICRIDKPIRCGCLKGFAPQFPKEWDLQDWSSGCTRIAPLNCKSGDCFLEVRGVKYPDMLTFWVNTSTSLDECKAKCLKNCSCTAYSNAYITNGGSGCIMWFGDLIDTRELSGADSTENIYVRLPASELVDYYRTNLEKRRRKGLQGLY